MSYQIGQIRKNQINSFLEQNPYRFDFIDNVTSIITFKDPCIFLSGANILSSLKSYYLKFRVKQLPGAVQKIKLKLTSDNVSINYSQNIKIITVDQGIDYLVYEILFTPNFNYNQIIFELERTDIDFQGSSRRLDIEILNLSIVKNIIEENLKNMYSGLESLIKIGLQGPPGLLFTINGEEIRIGRTEIYELYHKDIIITYLGFVIEDVGSEDNNFILDFKY